jgi:uncharacterized membrane protein
MDTDNKVIVAGDGAYARESRLRSLLKAISYRIIGTLTTASVVLGVTGDVTTAITIGTVEPIAKIVIYYVHERVWQLAPRGFIRRLFGRLRPTD